MGGSIDSMGVLCRGRGVCWILSESLSLMVHQGLAQSHFLRFFNAYFRLFEKIMSADTRTSNSLHGIKGIFNT